MGQGVTSAELVIVKTVRILLADDHKVVRHGTRALLSQIPEWEIIGEVDNGRDAVSMTEKLKPDIVILDIGMPQLNGLDATRQIKKICPQTEILIFTAHEAEELIHDVFDSGARSYIMKTDAADHLIDALKALAEHKHFFTSRISEVVFARYINEKKTPEPTPEKSRITDREREIVQLLAEGKTSKEIAATLGISVRTVETHRSAIMKKLRLKSFSELIRYAIRNRIVEA
jgi:DNA-binding NarL/FixJ family response regulator